MLFCSKMNKAMNVGQRLQFFLKFFQTVTANASVSFSFCNCWGKCEFRNQRGRFSSKKKSSVWKRYVLEVKLNDATTPLPTLWNIAAKGLIKENLIAADIFLRKSITSFLIGQWLFHRQIFEQTKQTISFSSSWKHCLGWCSAHSSADDVLLVFCQRKFALCFLFSLRPVQFFVILSFSLIHHQLV